MWRLINQIKKWRIENDLKLFGDKFTNKDYLNDLIGYYDDQKWLF